MFKDAGWQIHCSPCNESGKRASAGVRGLWKEDEVKIYPDMITYDELRNAYECGMVGKYTMDMGWGRCFTVYNIYGGVGWYE